MWSLYCVATITHDDFVFERPATRIDRTEQNTVLKFTTVCWRFLARPGLTKLFSAAMSHRPIAEILYRPRPVYRLRAAIESLPIVSPAPTRRDHTAW